MVLLTLMGTEGTIDWQSFTDVTQPLPRAPSSALQEKPKWSDHG